MQNVSLSGNATPATPNAYSPSVPISVYREVAAELQAAQAMLASLKAHNQQLTQQNQQLRQEIETVINAAQQLQQAVNAAQAGSQSGKVHLPSVQVHHFNLEPPQPLPVPPSPSSSLAEPTSASPAVALTFAEPEPPTPLLSEQLFTEEPEAPYRLRSQPKTSSDIGSLWLAVAMFLIVITAFGAGYWIVRPILMKR
ncbi:MAG: hypothetical protein ACM37W_28000 [Actinomycetota bacterium]